MSIFSLVENSNLCEDFKSQILDSLNDGGDIIIHLDECLYFLQSEGINTSEEDELKLVNYLKKYISENIPSFPYVITTEDYVVIFEPDVQYDFSDDELPRKTVIETDLYSVNFSFLDLRKFKNKYHIVGGDYRVTPLGRQHWFSFLGIGGLSKEESEGVRDIIQNEEWDKLDFKKYFKNDKKDVFEFILKNIDSFELTVCIEKLSL
jgi:hypothetical protein